MWATHGALVWRAERFVGSPTFYPVYHYAGHYSFSLLNLILIKGIFRFDPAEFVSISNGQLPFLPADAVIDLDIQRIGAPPVLDGTDLCTAQALAEALATALRADVAQAEDRNPSATNIILCGGKDSLNLALLPWKNPVLIYSAPPNTPLVRDFVVQNCLDIEVRDLDDPVDQPTLAEEVLENCSRADLRHFRWTNRLRAIARQAHGPVIFWKGQLGDVLTTDYWKAYQYPPNVAAYAVRKLYRDFGTQLPSHSQRLISRMLIKALERALWRRGAGGQGTHVAFLRALTDNLVLSAYHGPNVQRVFSATALPQIEKRDIRPQIGALLHGREVIYPATNPGPALCEHRRDLHSIHLFSGALANAGLTVEVTTSTSRWNNLG